MYKPSKPSAHLVASTKLQHEWSANRCVPHISSSWLDELLNDSSFSTMNSMAKIRLLLAGLLALDKPPDLTAAGARPVSQQQAASRAELQTSLQRLRDVVAADTDEWDKVMAAAAGPMDGRLDLDEVMQRSPAVGLNMNCMALAVLWPLPCCISIWHISAVPALALIGLQQQAQIKRLWVANSWASSSAWHIVDSMGACSM
jgi:hypothetical protein